MPKIGRVEYYERAFERMEKEHKHTWNWGAFCFGAIWMLYRKMYLYFFVWFVICAISIALNATLGINLITRALLGYYGNYLYYKTVKKKNI